MRPLMTVKICTQIYERLRQTRKLARIGIGSNRHLSKQSNRYLVIWAPNVGLFRRLVMVKSALVLNSKNICDLRSERYIGQSYMQHRGLLLIIFIPGLTSDSSKKPHGRNLPCQIFIPHFFKIVLYWCLDLIRHNIGILLKHNKYIFYIPIPFFIICTTTYL